MIEICAHTHTHCVVHRARPLTIKRKIEKKKSQINQSSSLHRTLDISIFRSSGNVSTDVLIPGHIKTQMTLPKRILKKSKQNHAHLTSVVLISNPKPKKKNKNEEKTPFCIASESICMYLMSGST